MSRKIMLIKYVRDNLEPAFDPERQPLTQLLDSVSLMQLIMYIDQSLAVPIDLSALSLDMFATIDTLVSELEQIKPEKTGA